MIGSKLESELAFAISVGLEPTTNSSKKNCTTNCTMKYRLLFAIQSLFSLNGEEN